MTAASQALLEGAMRLAHSPIQNYVLPGLTSYLIGEPSNKGRIRLFHATRMTRELVTPHNHRYDFTCYVLEGGVNNILYISAAHGEQYAMGCIKPLGELGEYEFEPGSEEPVSFVTKDCHYAAGSTYQMTHHEFHSIQFYPETKVLFFEGPNLIDHSWVLEPWCYGKRVPTFKTEEWMFQNER